MPFPRYLLLDLDDTILDYDKTGERCWRHFNAVYAARAGVDEAAMWKALSASRDWYWSDGERHRAGRNNQLEARRIIVRKAFQQLQLKDKALAEEFAEVFTRERELSIQLFPGAVHALQRLWDAEVHMALVTNGQASLQWAKLDRFGLARYFQHIHVEGEHGYGKPDPRVFHEALAHLGAIDPSTAWMAGDDLRFDILPAKAQGLVTAWVVPDSKSDPAADVIVASLAELVDGWETGETS